MGGFRALTRSNLCDSIGQFWCFVGGHEIRCCEISWFVKNQEVFSVRFDVELFHHRCGRLLLVSLVSRSKQGSVPLRTRMSLRHLPEHSLMFARLKRPICVLRTLGFWRKDFFL